MNAPTIERLEEANEHLVTRADLPGFESGLRAYIARIEDRQRAELHKVMGDLKSDLRRWMVTLVVAGICASVPISVAVTRLFD